MVRDDPYTPPTQKRYECPRCSFRTVTDESMGVCPSCDEPLRNLAVPRE